MKSPHTSNYTRNNKSFRLDISIMCHLLNTTIKFSARVISWVYRIVKQQVRICLNPQFGSLSSWSYKIIPGRQVCKTLLGADRHCCHTTVDPTVCHFWLCAPGPVKWIFQTDCFYSLLTRRSWHLSLVWILNQLGCRWLCSAWCRSVSTNVLSGIKNSCNSDLGAWSVGISV